MATEITDRYDEFRQPGEQLQVELLRGTIDTDGSGNGTLTVSLEGYGDAPIVQVTSDAGSAANVTANSFDLTISGGTASTTVTVEALVTGPVGVA